LSARLQAAGLRISAGDRFVIGAAHTLIVCAADDLSFDEINMELDAMRVAVGLTAGVDDESAAPKAASCCPNEDAPNRMGSQFPIVSKFDPAPAPKSNGSALRRV
jgi:hypothetical protein